MPITLNGTTGASFPDGSAGTPAEKGSTSSTAGIFYPAANTVAISTNSTEALRVDSSQNVGIGVTPSYKLDVLGPIAIRRSTVSARISTLSNENGNFEITADSVYNMVFITGGTERARIDSSGNLLVGYTSSNGAYKLQVNSQIFATSATIATSDARYKENVEPITDGLALVNTLNPVSFDWKPHPVHAFNTEHKTVGFLAQEVQTAMADKPYVNSIIKESECELPDGTKEKFLGIAEGNMVSILTKAIQELSAKLDAAEARIAALEAK